MKNKIPPPILAIVSIYFMYALKDLFPNFSFPYQNLVASLIGIEALFIVFVSAREFKKLKTTISPIKLSEVSSLVTNGTYKFSRNPMYLALISIQVAFGIYLGNWLFVILIILFAFYMTKYQIIPEEYALLEKFGNEYKEYCSITGRWL